MKIKVTELPKKPTDCLFCGRVWRFDENGCRESWECEIGGICRNTAECTKLEPEAQLPKEGAWKKILQNSDGTSDYECSACLGIIMDVPDDDKHPLCDFCPLCGAKMKGERR